MNKNLPDTIPIFPLSNAIFFPKTNLPLNIFEKKYIQLVNDCIKGERLFGMIQPQNSLTSAKKVYNVGCLGKITNFNETNDNRLLINLFGITRFKIKEEIVTEKLYRKFEVDYSDFENDLNAIKIDKDKINPISLLKKIKILFEKKNHLINWKELQKLSLDQLVYTLCMISPFSSQEKQKLLEANKIEDSINALEEIINFNLVDSFQSQTIQ